MSEVELERRSEIFVRIIGKAGSVKSCHFRCLYEKDTFLAPRAAVFMRPEILDDKLARVENFLKGSVDFTRAEP
jgi:hypothetical protein